MAAQQTDYYNFAAGNVNVTTTNETQVGTSRAVSTAFAGQQLFVQFGFIFVAGTAATAITIKILQGVVTGGTAIYTGPSITLAAGARGAFVVAATDSLAGDVSGQQYCVTVTQVAATGNGTASNVWSAVTVG